MTDETKTETKPATAEAAERPSTIPPEEMARLTDDIVGALKTVYDPEIPADIYELGLSVMSTLMTTGWSIST